MTSALRHFWRRTAPQAQLNLSWRYFHSSLDASSWEAAKIKNITVKWFSSCRFLHPSIYLYYSVCATEWIINSLMALWAIYVGLVLFGVKSKSGKDAVVAHEPLKSWEVQGSCTKIQQSWEEYLPISFCFFFVCISGGLNLGKKVSVPKDVMIEELNLTSNRGSRMFLERQKRVEKFTVENTSDAPVFLYVRHEFSYSDVSVKGFATLTCCLYTGLAFVCDLEVICILPVSFKYINTNLVLSSCIIHSQFLDGIWALMSDSIK